MNKKLWLIENEMYSAYDTHTISNVFYGTWLQAAKECIKNTKVKGDSRKVKEIKTKEIKDGFLTFNFL